MRTADRIVAVCILATLGILGPLAVGWSATSKQIAVYSRAANYSLPTMERHGTDYVGLLELLEPLGSVNAAASGNRWILHYNNIQSVFTSNSTAAVIGNQHINLNAPFELENGRGVVPLSSLSALLSHFLNAPVNWNQDSRRLLIGNVAVHFIAQIKQNNPPALVIDFSSPVNPQVSTEPGKLLLKFTHEAVVAPGTAVLTFDSKSVTSAHYSEADGVAEITIAGTVPLFAAFSNNGRTITIGPPAQIAAQIQQSQNATSVAPSPTVSNGVAASPTVAGGAQQYFVVIDAAHGGQERGAALSDKLNEKDVTLAIARRLRQELQDRGIGAFLLRDGDATLTLDQRAVMTNHIHPAIYICIHATSNGSGVRLYTSLLPPGAGNHGPFMNWNTAQASFLPSSQGLQTSLAATLQQSHLTIRTLPAPLRPLNNLVVPAVAVEVAPSTPGAADLANSTYQELIASSLAVGISAVRNHASQVTP